MKAYIKVLSSVLAMIMVMSGVSIFGVSAEDGYTQPEEFIYGDVDFDSKVTVKDATFIQKGVAGLEYLTGVQRFLADPKGLDVTVRDATTIQKKLAGISVEDSLVGSSVDMALQEKFSSNIYFIENRSEDNYIMAYVLNPNWEYTLKDFPEYEFSDIRVYHYKYDKFPDIKVCYLYLSIPGKESVENAIRALDYRANLDLEDVVAVTTDRPH